MKEKRDIHTKILEILIDKVLPVLLLLITCLVGMYDASKSA